MMKNEYKATIQENQQEKILQHLLCILLLSIETPIDSTNKFNNES